MLGHPEDWLIITEGYELYGNAYEFKGKVCQAMVKYEDEEG